MCETAPVTKLPLKQTRCLSDPANGGLRCKDPHLYDVSLVPYSNTDNWVCRHHDEDERLMNWCEQ